MNKQRLITLVVLTLVLAAFTGGGFVLAGNGASTLHGDPTYEQWLSDFGDGTVVTSIDDIDPDECNWIHNITACEGEPEPGVALGEPYLMPIADKPCGPSQTVAVTSDGHVTCLGTAGDTPTSGLEPGEEPPLVVPLTPIRSDEQVEAPASEPVGEPAM